jgi:hypothetical protein
MIVTVLGRGRYVVVGARGADQLLLRPADDPRGRVATVPRGLVQVSRQEVATGPAYPAGRAVGVSCMVRGEIPRRGCWSPVKHGTRPAQHDQQGSE